MPLMVEIHRDGEARPLRWGWFHLEAIHQALEAEGETLDSWDYAFKEQHRFHDTSDGEIFIIEPGDTVRAWR